MELITPSCRDSLTSFDKEFAVGALAKRESDTRACRELLDDPEERDSLFESDALYEAILSKPEAVGISPRFYFYVLVRRVFREAGLGERAVADYTAALLAFFSDARHAFGANRGQRQAFFYVVDALAEAGKVGPGERFALQVRLAERALFLTGIFPEHVERRRRDRAAPGMEFYESVGRSNYEAAGGHPIAQEFLMGDVYGALGGHFHEIRCALNRMAEELLFLGEPPELPEWN